MDEADAGQIHAVIAGRAGNVIVDIRTGKPAIRAANTEGGAIFHGGSMRRLVAAAEGGAYLGGTATTAHPLARLKGTGRSRPTSRSIIWGLARQQGYDPTCWQLNGTELVTWGGETFNTLLAAVLSRRAPNNKFTVTSNTVLGPLRSVDLSLDAVRNLAREIEAADDLPLAVASKFTQRSRYFGELSNGLAAIERRRSVPWAPFYRWLDSIRGIDKLGSVRSG
jgi:hypothetical protein